MTASYQEDAPSSRLAEHVECFWSLEATAATEQWVVPDACMDILLRLDKSVYAIDVIGSMTQSELAAIPAGHRYLGVRFKPGRLGQVVPVDSSSLVNSAQSLQTYFDQRDVGFCKKLGRAHSTQEKIELLERLLVVQADPLPAQRALDALVAKDGDMCTEELADLAALSERQLRRQCVGLTGLPPKVLARVLRFRKAYQSLQSDAAKSLAEIALDCGYSDQAHFSHDFTRFAGCPPGAWAKAKD